MTPRIAWIYIALVWIVFGVVVGVTYYLDLQDYRREKAECHK